MERLKRGNGTQFKATYSVRVDGATEAKRLKQILFCELIEAKIALRND